MTAFVNRDRAFGESPEVTGERVMSKARQEKLLAEMFPEQEPRPLIIPEGYPDPHRKVCNPLRFTGKSVSGRPVKPTSGNVKKD